MNEDRKLAGKVALVFGGSRGIGAAAARRLAREGADVALTYVSAPDKAADIVHAIEAEGCSGLAIRADSADVQTPLLSGARRPRLWNGSDGSISSSSTPASYGWVTCRR